jgi:hypothetical protein
MQPTNEDPKLLRIAIDELRHLYDHVSNIYDQVRIKALAVLAGEIALVAFIFSGDSLAMPSTPYGMIFFFIGILLLLGAFGFAFWTISAVDWLIPGDPAKLKNLNQYTDESALLAATRDEYTQAIEHCLPLVNKKTRKFNWCINTLVAGGIILLVIKFGGIS